MKAWKEILAEEYREVVGVAGDGRLAEENAFSRQVLAVWTWGVEAQLIEIEKGFFDLLQQRPA